MRRSRWSSAEEIQRRRIRMPAPGVRDVYNGAVTIACQSATNVTTRHGQFERCDTQCARVRSPSRVRLIAITLAGVLGIAATGTAAAASACRAHTSPAGGGDAELRAVHLRRHPQRQRIAEPRLRARAHDVRPSDTVEVLAERRVSGEAKARRAQAPGVTIRAEHIPAAGAAHRRSGSTAPSPYRYWSHPMAGIWSHPYTEDFCETSLRNLPCTQLSLVSR